MSRMSWNCPEISNCPEILLTWSECPDMVLCYAVVTALHLFFMGCVCERLISQYLAMSTFFLNTLPTCSNKAMCDGNRYRRIKKSLQDESTTVYLNLVHFWTCIFCVLVKPTKMSWNFVNIGSWNFTSCSWEPCNGFFFVLSLFWVLGYSEVFRLL